MPALDVQSTSVRNPFSPSALHSMCLPPGARGPLLLAGAAILHSPQGIHIPVQRRGRAREQHKAGSGHRKCGERTRAYDAGCGRGRVATLLDAGRVVAHAGWLPWPALLSGTLSLARRPPGICLVPASLVHCRPHRLTTRLVCSAMQMGPWRKCAATSAKKRACWTASPVSLASLSDSSSPVLLPSSCREYRPETCARKLVLADVK